VDGSLNRMLLNTLSGEFKYDYAVQATDQLSAIWSRLSLEQELAPLLAVKEFDVILPNCQRLRAAILQAACGTLHYFA